MSLPPVSQPARGRDPPAPAPHSIPGQLCIYNGARYVGVSKALKVHCYEQLESLEFIAHAVLELLSFPPWVSAESLLVSILRAFAGDRTTSQLKHRSSYRLNMVLQSLCPSPF